MELATRNATTGVTTRPCAHEMIVVGFPTYAEYLKQYGKAYGSLCSLYVL